MTHRNLFRSIAITTGAALIGLAGANAQAQSFAGNYQDHVLPSTTRHTASDHHQRSHDHYQRLAADNGRVEAGNYQDHVVPRTTRHAVDQVKARGMGEHDVAMSPAVAR